VSIKYLNDAWDMPLNCAEKMLLLAIADCANNEGYAYPGYETLVKKTGMGKATLSKYMKVLKGVGILKTESHGFIGVGKKVNTYTISLRCELAISSDRELIEKIKELRKLNSNAISSHLEQRKVHTANAKSSHREHEPSFEPPERKPSVLNTVKFIIPKLHEIEQHIADKNYSIDPEQFLAHYTSNGWMVGRNKMKCWKSAMVTWQKNAQKSPNSATNRNSGFAKQPQQRPVYTLKENRGAIDSTAETIINEQFRF
jgi:hypothetical protein